MVGRGLDGFDSQKVVEVLHQSSCEVGLAVSQYFLGDADHREELNEGLSDSGAVSRLEEGLLLGTWWHSHRLLTHSGVLFSTGAAIRPCQWLSSRRAGR